MKTKLFPSMSLLLIVGFAGCAGGVRNSMRLSEKDSAWNPLARLTEEKKKEATDKEAKPVTMAAIWKDSAYEKPGERTVVGFGGRFFFYDRDNNSVPAEGELVVYGYEDSDDGEGKPGEGADKKFVFRESEFQSHFSDTGLGASYSVWIPWEKIGGYRKSITLIPYFKTTDGRLLESGQSIVILPGKTSNMNMESAKSNPDQPYKVLGHSSAVVSHASYQPKRSANRASRNSRTNGESTKGNVSQASFEQSNSEGMDTQKIKTSQINLPKSMARRMASASVRERYERLQEERKAEIARMNSAHSAWTRPAAQPSANSAPEPQAQMPAQPVVKQPEPSAAPVAPPTRARTFGAPGGF